MSPPDLVADASASTDPAVLATYATHPLREVRIAVATSPHTPSDVLSSLADDHTTYVRRAVSANPNTPADTLTRRFNERFAGGYDAVDGTYVKDAARNPSLPLEVASGHLGGLLEARDNPAVHNPALAHACRELAAGLAVRRDLGEAEFWQIADAVGDPGRNDDAARAWVSIANRPDLPESVFHHLVTKIPGDAPTAHARRCQDPDRLTIMAAHPNPETRAAALKRRAAPDHAAVVAALAGGTN